MHSATLAALSSPLASAGCQLPLAVKVSRQVEVARSGQNGERKGVSGQGGELAEGTTGEGGSPLRRLAPDPNLIPLPSALPSSNFS